MRIRSIKPEFWSHRMHRRLSEPAALVAVALLNYADDAGRFEADVESIRVALFPYRNLTKSIEDCLQELVLSEWIVLYEAPFQGERVRFGQVLTFNRHQKVNRPQPSRLPAPTTRSIPQSSEGHSVNAHGALSESSVSVQGSFSDHSVNAHGALSDRSLREWNGMEGEWKGTARARSGSESGPQNVVDIPGGQGRSPQSVGDIEQEYVAPKGLRSDLAQECIEFLNQKSGAAFVATPAMLYDAALRLLEVNQDVAGVKQMIERQVALWKGNARMQPYLRPATLFEEKKFHEYYGQRSLPVEIQAADTKDRRKELVALIDKSPANKESVYHRRDVSEPEREQLREWRRELAQLGAA